MVQISAYLTAKRVAEACFEKNGKPKFIPSTFFSRFINIDKASYTFYIFENFMSPINICEFRMFASS